MRSSTPITSAAASAVNSDRLGGWQPIGLEATGLEFIPLMNETARFSREILVLRGRSYSL